MESQRVVLLFANSEGREAESGEGEVRRRTDEGTLMEDKVESHRGLKLSEIFSSPV